MYPDLSYFFHDMFGTPVDNFFSIFKTFGLLLALAFFASGYILYLEFVRKEKEGILKPLKKVVTINEKDFYQAIFGNALVGFFIGWKIPAIINSFSVFKSDPASIIFSSAGNLATGILAGIIVGAYGYFTGKKGFEARYGTHEINIYPRQKISDIVVIAAISGVAGARLFSVLENLDAFFQDPFGTIFSGSGLTVYGGLLVATFTVLYFVKKWGMPILHVMDAAAPSIIIGMLVGRLGCQFSGDGDWGIVNTAPKPDWFIFPDWAWSYSYPHNVNKAGVLMEDCIGLHCTELVPGVFPTPIYEVLMMTIIFIILWNLRKKINAPGVLFFIWMILSGIMRFFIEFIRVNDRYEFLGFNGSQAHWISIGFMIVGISSIAILWKKYQKELALQGKK